jgi:hypothetical protein
MANDIGEEAKIRDYLAREIDRLPELVSNFREVKNLLEAGETEFTAIAEDGGPTPIDLIRRILSKRDLRGLKSFYELELIDTEFVLLDTGRPGFQPRADILARCIEDSRLFLIEVKQLVQTERQAVTEMSAYLHGLNLRFWNLAPADYVWIPICSDWRTTVRAAFANEAIWANRPILPMRCKVLNRDPSGTVTGVELNIFSLLEDVGEPLALAQFAWHCFDTLTVQLHKEPSEPRALLEFISATAARQGFSGFVMYGKSIARDAFPYPYIYAISVHNPYLAALKFRQLEITRDNIEHGGTIAMRKQVKKPLWWWQDIDFRTMSDRQTPRLLQLIAESAAERGEESAAEKFRATGQEEYLSLKEMAISSGSRTRTLFDEIQARIALFCDFEVGTPSLLGLLTETIPVIFDHASTFGLFQEALFERLQWEIMNSNGGDGPVIGDYGGDPVRLIQSPNFLFTFMELMNFQHASQMEYLDSVR